MEPQSFVKFFENFYVVKSLNPFKSRVKHMTSFKLAVNPYRGCPYKCVYCYIYGYTRMSDIRYPASKKLFKRRFRRDLREYARLGLPKYPVYLSSSCEPLHPFLEKRYGNTLYALKALKEEGFPVVISTKNPTQLLKEEYLEALDRKSTVIHVSVPFLDNRFEPNASLPIGRIWAASRLVKEGLTVYIRVEPVIPSYGAVAGQSKMELKTIVKEARKAGVYDIISKCLLLPIGVSKVYPSFYRELKPYYLRHGYSDGTYCMLDYSTRIKLLMPLYEACRRSNVRLWTQINDLPFSEAPSCNELEDFVYFK